MRRKLLIRWMLSVHRFAASSPVLLQEDMSAGSVGEAGAQAKREDALQSNHLLVHRHVALVVARQLSLQSLVALLGGGEGGLRRQPLALLRPRGGGGGHSRARLRDRGGQLCQLRGESCVLVLQLPVLGARQAPCAGGVSGTRPPTRASQRTVVVRAPNLVHLHQVVVQQSLYGVCREGRRAR